MSTIKWTKNPFLLFLPFLFLYICISVIFPTHGTSGDEPNYLIYAGNLLNGFYSPPPPAISLRNGPFYPLLLVPFLALHIPLIFITLLNSFFLYFSIIFLFKSLVKVVQSKAAIWISVFWGLYYHLYLFIPYILPEIFTVFLVSILMLNVLRTFDRSNLKVSFRSAIYAGLIIGMLALTKPIFGYVILFLLVVVSVLILFNRKSPDLKKCILLLGVSILLNVPYLLYTYNLTGKIFYWSSVGGENLYWMSTPYEMEKGDWISYPISEIDHLNKMEGSVEMVEAHHNEDMEVIYQYDGTARDSVYKAMAVRNIKSHPLKFVENCFSNISRMLFNFPYSYQLQNAKNLLRLPHNGIILLFSLFSIVLTLANWRKTSFAIRFLLVFALVYLGGSVFGSAEIRMFAMVVPIFLVWNAYILGRSVKVIFNWKLFNP